MPNVRKSPRGKLPPRYLVPGLGRVTPTRPAAAKTRIVRRNSHDMHIKVPKKAKVVPSPIRQPKAKKLASPPTAVTQEQEMPPTREWEGSPMSRMPMPGVDLGCPTQRFSPRLAAMAPGSSGTTKLSAHCLSPAGQLMLSVGQAFGPFPPPAYGAY